MRSTVADEAASSLIVPRSQQAWNDRAFANRGDRPAVFNLNFTPALRREGFFEGSG